MYASLSAYLLAEFVIEKPLVRRELMNQFKLPDIGMWAYYKVELHFPHISHVKINALFLYPCLGSCVHAGPHISSAVKGALHQYSSFR